MRARWGSQLGFILATAGSAIGLGNIWRFPYMVGQNGGGSFLFLYVISVVVVGYFLMLSKLAFGRLAGTNIVDGFQAATAIRGRKISSLWGLLGGWLAILNAVLVASTYVVVIGWTLSYVFEAVGHLLGQASHPLDKETFTRLTGSFVEQFFWGFLCVSITAAVLIKGVKKGIEKISLILMPFLFVLLILLLLWVLMMPGTEKGLLFFLTPDFEQLGFTADGFSFHTFASLWLKVLGQMMYSLSMGLGVVYIYGSYLPAQSPLKSSAKWVVALDTLVAFMAGLIVLPAVFAFELEPTSGPALSFVSLPLIFAQISGGSFLMLLFFLLLFVAALTSVISIYEPVVNLLIEKAHLKRLHATLLFAAANMLGTGIVLASFTGLVPLKIVGRDLFEALDILTGTYTMPLMVLVCSLFMGWIISTALVRNIAQGSGERMSRFEKRYIRLTLRLTVPVILLVLFFNALFRLS